MNTLRLLIWPDYIDPENVRAFESEFSLRVEFDIVPSAVELVESVRTGGTPADVIVPPDYAVRELNAEKRLLTLNHAQIPDLKNLDTQSFKGRGHDPETQVSVPKDWGTTGFMYREDMISERPVSWGDFWALAVKYFGKVTLLNSPGEVIGAALKLRGHSYNSMETDHLAQARVDLQAIRQHVTLETNYRPLLETGEAWMSLGWNGDAFALRSKGVPVRYAVPAEGSQKWEDDWAIPVNARNAAGAHEFINFMLRADVAVREARYTGYATPNRAAYDQLDEATRNDPSVYPPAEVIEKLEWGLPVERDFSMVW